MMQASWSLILFTTVLLTVSHADEVSIAIARPFSPVDVEHLRVSFDSWRQFLPCRPESTVRVDLVLVYSQRLFESVSAKAAVEAVKHEFRTNEAWAQCIDRVLGIDVDILPSEDLYHAHEQSTNPLWVNGPNRQFERTVRRLDGFYDLMYLMEMDSVPRQAFWLDSLLEEVQTQSTQSEFAILGSKYRGNKWESLEDQIPWALRNHINGNAFYNLNHPLLRAIVKQLEEEARTAANSIPYDYRIAQMVEEVLTGEEPGFFAGHDSSSRLPQHFTAFMEQFDLERVIRETQLIGDYSSTNILSSQLRPEEVVIHGARVMESWNRSRLGNVTLVVSDDRASLDIQPMLSSLDSTQHDFSAAVVLTPNLLIDPDVELPSSIPVTFQARLGQPVSTDLCTVDIATPWFVLSNSWYKLHEPSAIMAFKDRKGTRPLVSFDNGGMEACASNPTCVRDLNLAREIIPGLSTVYDDFDFVFDTVLRNEYCLFLENTDWQKFPSATSFVAYLQRIGQFDHVYATSDRRIYGSNFMFVNVAAEADEDVFDGETRTTARRLACTAIQGGTYGCTPSKKKGKVKVGPPKTKAPAQPVTKAPGQPLTKAPALPKTKGGVSKKFKVRVP